MSDEPFGRQPKPVTVTVAEGEHEDIVNFTNALMSFAEHRYDLVVRNSPNSFRIYPRAVND